MTLFRILVLGGSGIFGRRLCARLAAEPSCVVLLASRSRARAEARCAEILRERPAARIEAVSVTLPGELSGVLTALRPDLVIDASGPFQGRSLELPETCIAHGVHWLDLADARDYVRRFAGLNAAARAAGVVALSGASSLPGLSSVVVASLAQGLERLERVEIAILSAQRQPRGLAMLEGVLETVGRPMTVLRNGRRRTVFGWQEARRLSPRDPLRAKLGRRWLGAFDAPDLDSLPASYPELQDVRFHAGLEVSCAHLGLWALSWPVRWGLVSRLTPLARGLGALADAVSLLGSERGGMQVGVTGQTAGGRRLRRGWRLVAEQGQGPWVPTLPALLVARRLARLVAGERRAGPALDSGARACINAFSLPEFEAAIAGLAIGTETTECPYPNDGETLARAA